MNEKVSIIKTYLPKTKEKLIEIIIAGDIHCNKLSYEKRHVPETVDKAVILHSHIINNGFKLSHIDVVIVYILIRKYSGMIAKKLRINSLLSLTSAGASLN